MYSVTQYLDAAYWLVYSVVAGSFVVPALMSFTMLLLISVWFVSLGDRR